MNDSIINTLISLAKNESDIAAIWLYGSRATNNFSSESDYDLAVLFSSYISDPLDSRLRPELLAMDWQQIVNHNSNGNNDADNKNSADISIIDVNKVGIPLAFSAISGELLYCNDQGLRMSAEAIICSKAELDFHHRDNGEKQAYG